jgi:hypothetical protein
MFSFFIFYEFSFVFEAIFAYFWSPEARSYKNTIRDTTRTSTVIAIVCRDGGLPTGWLGSKEFQTLAHLGRCARGCLAIEATNALERVKSWFGYI